MDIEQLKKEAREKWHKRTDEDSNDKLGGWSFVMFEEDADDIANFWLEIIDHIHEQTVLECLNVIPDVKPQPETPTGIDYELAQFHYKNEAYARLEYLLNPGV